MRSEAELAEESRGKRATELIACRTRSSRSDDCNDLARVADNDDAVLARRLTERQELRKATRTPDLPKAWRRVLRRGRRAWRRV